MLKSTPRQFGALLLLSCHLLACQHGSHKTDSVILQDEPIKLAKRDVRVVFIPEHQRVPHHIIYQRQDHYSFGKNYQMTPFKLEMSLNPLMRNPHVVARIWKNGQVVSEVVAKKASSSLLGDKKTQWSPGKLVLVVPFVTGDQVVVTTTYEWMDIRWLPPILLQENEPIAKSTLMVDVPYGISMRFKAVKDSAGIELVPSSLAQEKALWIQQENKAGLGMSYLWSAPAFEQSKSPLTADRLQVLLSFETPSQRDGMANFDNWQSVASYLYDRIDRYDMPSNEIRDFTIKATKDKATSWQKLEQVLSFLRSELEKKVTVGSYQEQDVQPATRTFARRFGSPFDIAILGKAMLSSIGINSDLVAVADRRYNPSVADFFSPTLFSSIILAIFIDRETHYFDPREGPLASLQLDQNIQGQQALLIKPHDSSLFAMPYADARKNTKTISYQLWMNDDGWLEGDYSFDLLGLESHGMEELDQSRMVSPGLVEARLLGEHGALCSFETVEVMREQALGGAMHISGQIKPLLLPKNDGGSFVLKLTQIIDLVFKPLVQVRQKGYSSITNLSLFLIVPDDFAVESLPKDVNLTSNGVESRISASYADGQLVVEGTTVISLPVRREEKLGDGLSRLRSFAEQGMVIKDLTMEVRATDGDQRSTDAQVP